MTQTEKERILFNLLTQTKKNPFLDNYKIVFGYPLIYFEDNPRPQFIPLKLAEKMGEPVKPGDIVRRKTVRNDVTFGYFEVIEVICQSEMIVHELANPKKTCRIYNKNFYVLRFIDPYYLLYGLKYKIDRWIRAAFKKHSSSLRYIEQIVFEDDRAIVYVRPQIMLAEKKLSDGNKLYAKAIKATIPYDKKTKYRTITQIVLQSQIGQTDFIYE